MEDVLKKSAVKRMHGVVARQKSEQQALKELEDFFTKENTGKNSSRLHRQATFEVFVQFCDELSGSISDDGFFALQLTNLWGAL